MQPFQRFGWERGKPLKRLGWLAAYVLRAEAAVLMREWGLPGGMSGLGPVLLLLLLAFGLQAAQSPNQSQSPPPQPFVVGISPFLDKPAKDDLYRGLVRLLIEELPLNTTLALYDAFNLKSVCQATVPNVAAFKSPKTRANQFYPAIRDLKLFLAADHPKPTRPPLDFADAIRLPQFLDFLAEHPPPANSPLAILLVGSPLYQDAKETAFSMIDGYFPSDGHLLASREQSVFGLSPQANHAPPLAVHWLYFGDPWLSELHKEKVTRFWTLFLQQHAARLAALTGDLPSALRSFLQDPAASPAPSRGWSLDPRQTRIEMLRVGRDVQLADWLTRGTLPDPAPLPPSAMVGPMKIGIRWKDDIDLDLYATPRRGAETLFFQHPRSPEGYLYKDHRASPGRDYEFIEFESPVDIRQVEAYVNFHRGSRPGGPRGEVRIEFDRAIYSAPFSIPASQGNFGRSGQDQQAFWTRLPILRILHLARAEN